ncbi:MAG TPA: hypothetical protein VFW71_06460 [Actinomycetota bacterium]|nr:hypothetical protein [Actinomycetota bacterium]
MATAQQQGGLAPAALPSVHTPNLYTLQGGTLHVMYATTGIDGKPHFSYQNGTHTLTFSGSEIRTVDTEIGTLVTVSIQMTVDSGNTVFSVLIPAVNLGSSEQVPIHTEGITTVHRFSIVPIFNHGQTELYSVTPLSGEARFVLS